MDERRVGRSLHVLRRARRISQAEVAARAGTSQASVSAIERGHWASMSCRTLARVFDVLEADVDVLVRYRSGEIDRLLDEGHSRIVSGVAQMLRGWGWRVEPEVTFNHFGDRGSIDLLAMHDTPTVVLVVEAKTRITSAEETLRRLDTKNRLAERVAGDRFGLCPRAVMGLLAVRDSTANRARIAGLEPLYGPAFPCRGRVLTSTLRHPAAAVAASGGINGPTRLGRAAVLPDGLMFVRDISPADETRQRQRARGRARPASSVSRA